MSPEFHGVPGICPEFDGIWNSVPRERRGHDAIKKSAPGENRGRFDKFLLRLYYFFLKMVLYFSSKLWADSLV